MRQLQTETIKNLIIYEPGKPVEEVKREYGLSEIAKLASNENPFGPSPKAIDAVNDYLAKTNLYPDGGGYYLGKRLEKKYDFPYERIILGNGSCELIEMAAKAFLMPGENAVISEHAFIMGYIAAKAVNGEVIQVPMKDGVTIDAKAMAEAVDENTKILYIPNPNNPTGTYVTEDEMDYLFENIPRGVVVILDEAYKEYIEEPDFPDSMKYLDKHSRLLILRTFSKAYGLAGMRIGYGFGSEEIIQGLNRVRSPFNTSSVGQIAGKAALDDVEHLEKSVKLNARERSFLCSELESMGIEYTDSVTNFILVNIEENTREMFEDLLKRGVIVRPMEGYGYPESFRLSVGTHEENVKFLEALSEVLEDY